MSNEMHPAVDVWQCPPELQTAGRHLWHYACDTWQWLVASDLAGLRLLAAQVDDIEQLLRAIRCDLACEHEATTQLLDHMLQDIQQANEWASRFGITEYDKQRLGLIHMRDGITAAAILDIERDAKAQHESSRQRYMPHW
jgi:hypothetical protein